MAVFVLKLFEKGFRIIILSFSLVCRLRGLVGESSVKIQMLIIESGDVVFLNVFLKIKNHKHCLYSIVLNTY